jgi:hypothetical protein
MGIVCDLALLVIYGNLQAFLSWPLVNYGQSNGSYIGYDFSFWESLFLAFSTSRSMMRFAAFYHVRETTRFYLTLREDLSCGTGRNRGLLIPPYQT